MEVGKYADGRTLNYDEETQQFDVGGAAVTTDDVLGYDREGQVEWLSDDLKALAHALTSGSVAPIDAGAVTATVATPASGKGLFGFRSRKPWKMLVASAYYLFAGVIAIGLLVSRKQYANSGADIALEVLSGFLMSLVLLAPAFLLSDFGYRDKLPLFKRRKIVWSALGLAVFFVLMLVTAALADTLHTAPYRAAAAKEAAQQNAEANAKQAAEGKRQTEEDAKRAADEKAQAAAEASAAAAAAAQDPAPMPAPKPTPAAPPKTETKADYLRKVITDELGQETNMGDKPTIREIADSGGDAFWLVRLNGSENLTNQMTKKGMWLNTKDVWQRVFTERKDIDELAIFWYFPLVDAKGNTTDEVVMKLWMTKKNAADVKWDNVLLKNIPVIADGYWESQVFNN